MSGEAHRGIEAAKWLAFALMVADHVNAYILPKADFIPLVYLLGRLVFPLFALCLAFGLSGRGSLVLDATIRRLLVWACIAQVPWAYFTHGAGLNVLFTLAFGAMAYQAVFVRNLGWLRYTMAAGGFLLCFVAEYSLPGLVTVFGAMWFAESRSRYAGALALMGIAALQTQNATWFALLAPLVFWAVYSHAELPRLRHAFYWMYPAHFVALGFVRWWL